MKLHIAHLSDIHFSCDPDRIGHDPAEHMRTELARDLVDQAKRHGGLHAIIISGDIAYGGRADEYKLAHKWLQHLCEQTECPQTRVFICPGNHDVDHAILKKRSVIEDSHSAIRRAPSNEQRNKELIKRLKLDDNKKIFYESLENFNNFALSYNCSFYADRDNYAWSRDLTLNDGSILRLRGLNSAILSGQKDNVGDLFLGREAWSIGREAGVEYMAFSHHPPKWLLDGDEMLNELDDRARIQLYGHEHDARIVPMQRTVRLYAGAVNPHRSQTCWVPGYNFLQISVDNDGKNRTMFVRIHAREWQSKSPSQFKAYAGNCEDDSHEVKFALDPWTVTTPLKTVSGEPLNASNDPVITVGQVNIDELPREKKISLDNVMHAFLDLERLSQKTIVERLGLGEEVDNGLPDFMKLKKALLRAKERNQLAELNKLINTDEFK